jgi:hypothetical protein
MIEETSAFLTWALSRDLPRIPTRPVEAGGFEMLTRRPDGRAMAARWWAAALRTLGRD